MLIDSVGTRETNIEVHAYSARPAVWVPEAEFLVRFAAHESDDLLLTQVMRDGESKGEPVPCRPRGFFKACLSG